MTVTRSASTQIAEQVVAWPGVASGIGERGELSFTVGRAEIGHLHGDRVAHFAFQKQLGTELRIQGRVVDHPVFPGAAGMAARPIGGHDDVVDVIALMRLNYDRIVARYGLPEGA